MDLDRRAIDIEGGGCQLSASLWQPRAPRAILVALQPRELDRLLPSHGHVLERVCLHGFAVLAVGLVTAAEESSLELATARRFDIEGLALRTIKALDWISARGAREPIGVLASGTAAAAALYAATRRRVGAIVSIAGRPDLAAPVLPRVNAPTLFVVGEDDVPHQHFSQLGADRMLCTCEMQVIPGSGALERREESEATAKLVLGWLERHLWSAPSGQERLQSRAERAERPREQAIEPKASASKLEDA
jgi:pimeloyl-ACP methyl ester carboxylesterase